MNDYADIWDTDRDGLTDNREALSWQVVVTPIKPRSLDVASVCRNGACVEPTPLAPVVFNSDSAKADTDGDGLTDYEEFKLKTNPTSKDTDADRLTDYEEMKGFKLRDLATPIMTDPTKVDTDNDKRSDGEEADRVAPIMVIRIPGKAPYQVYSHPLNADADFDFLVDGDEQAFGTKPAAYNTDGDNQTDYNEVLASRRPTVPDYHVELTFNSIYVIKDGDEAVSNDPGEISWNLAATATNMPGGQTSNLNKSLFSANSGATIPLNTVCTTPPCRTTYDMGAVSTTPAQYEASASWDSSTRVRTSRSPSASSRSRETASQPGTGRAR